MKLLVVKLGTRSIESIFWKVLLKQFVLYFCLANFVHATIFAKQLVLLEGILWNRSVLWNLYQGSNAKVLAIAVSLVGMLVAIDQVIVRN